MFIENENSGLVFNNDSDNPKAPVMSGCINVNGEQFRIALWEKEGNNGIFYSVNVQENDDEPEEETPKRSGGRSSGNASSRNSGQRSGGGKPQRSAGSSRNTQRSGKPTR